MKGSEYLIIPRDGVSDDVVEILEWLAKEGERVLGGAPLVEVESSKSVTALSAHRDGFLIQLAREGARLRVGEPVAIISDEPRSARTRELPAEDEPLVSRRAAQLMAKEGLTLEHFPGARAVRERDVLDVLGVRPDASSQARRFADEPLTRDDDWDSPLESGEYRAFRELATDLRRRMKARYNRHVPTGTLLYDRWDLARDYGFGEGTSVYDESLILGDVEVGRHCWIGPFTVLDGARAPLSVGDYTQVGSGSHLYTHNTIEHTLTGGKAEPQQRMTRVGRCCFISPMSVIGPGTDIGDHSFVATGSYVQGEFPPYSYISGAPARLVGKVEVDGARARLRLTEDDSTG